MPSKLTELTLIYRRERIRWDETAILECEEPEDPLAKEKLLAFSEAEPHDTRKAYMAAVDAVCFAPSGVIVKAEACPADELVGGLSYRFYGRWTEHAKHGKQFIAKTFVRVQPHGRGGVIRYLTTTCAGHGVGQSTAQKLWDKFQGDAVRILREQPDVAAAAVGMPHFTDEKAAAASAVLKQESALEAVHIDLIDLLGGRGFPRDVPKRAVGEWGNRAAELIHRNSYLLMRFPRCGFLRTDQLYLDLGGRPAAIKRQALAGWYAISRDSEGHTWHRPEVAEQGIRSRVAGAEVDPVKALRLAKRAKLLSVMRNGDGQPWLAESRKAANERTVAERVRTMLWPETVYIGQYERTVEEEYRKLDHTRCTRCNRKLTADTVAILNDHPYGPDCITKIVGGELAEHVPMDEWLAGAVAIVKRIGVKWIGTKAIESKVQWPEVDGLDISEHQKAELKKALQSSLGLFGGSPGTGKTYSAARLIGRLNELCGGDQVAVAAPTGKAAVRITEALESYGIKKAATTIHRLLGVASNTAGEGWTFAHDEHNPLPFKYIIIDEASMVDTDLMAALLRACSVGTHVLLVGDVNQLPPVGHGAPLRDMIAAGVPSGDLREIHRNAGSIVQACADIRDSKRWDTVKDLDPESGANLKLVPAANGEAAVEKIVATIQKIKEAELYDPIWGVQVIVAVNKKSVLSRRDLNKRLQAEFNPAGERAGSNPFRVGDKIVCLKNSLMPIVEDAPMDCNVDAVDSKVFVANGEQARVVKVLDKLTIVSLDSPKRLVKIPRGTENGGGQADDNAAGGEEDPAASDTGCQWDLAYAISCHKAQGSEWPCVIVALDEYPGARRVCSREWLYTAISRAKGVCLLVGKRATADGMCCQRAISKRKTFLTERIKGTVQ